MALPHRHHTVSERSQASHRSAISSDVGGKLCAPKGRVRLGSRRSNAVRVPMPETPVHEDGALTGAVHEIRPSGQRVSVVRQSEPQRASDSPDVQFGCRAVLAHSRHQTRTSRRCRERFHGDILTRSGSSTRADSTSHRWAWRLGRSWERIRPSGERRPQNRTVGFTLFRTSWPNMPAIGGPRCDRTRRGCGAMRRRDLRPH